MSDPPTVSQGFVAAFEALGYQPDSPAPTGPYTKFPNKIKATLIRVNESDTPAAAGERATRLIRRFLTCLDEDDEEEDEADGNEAGTSGDAVEPVVLVDEDERRVAMHFVDTALKDLRNLACTV
ncbi:hypothetical protein NUW58_g9647 [Xylaria curta]|uniref:Uncharacterized protein n=1 Tax=Xylaria curta TaxID=42375 RepID=A0ACC1MU83_9PEZI|nr:hypothetical protein NUW58_g9647 [Xylaria curta]